MATGSYFPSRVPKTIKFTIDEADPTDQYARLYAPGVVTTVNALHLPRYGLGNYVSKSPDSPPTNTETKHIQDLSRAGKRLMGFCRTNLFKRLESSGAAFLLSVERHLLRNHVFRHALRNGLPLPLGTQDAEMLDLRFTDSDADAGHAAFLYADDEEEQQDSDDDLANSDNWTAASFESRASEVYAEYATTYRSRFRWLRSDLFVDSLEHELQSDSDALLGILRAHGRWNSENDAKLQSLHTLLTATFPDQKVLVFSSSRTPCATSKPNSGAWAWMNWPG